MPGGQKWLAGLGKDYHIRIYRYVEDWVLPQATPLRELNRKQIISYIFLNCVYFSILIIHNNGVHGHFHNVYNVI